MLGIRKSAFGRHFDFMMFMLIFSILCSRFNFESGHPSPTHPQYVNRSMIIALYIAMAVIISMERLMHLKQVDPSSCFFAGYVKMGSKIFCGV